MSALRLERLTGSRLAALLPDLAGLRIAVFRDFPYLYDGSPAYEQRYLATYARARGSVIVGAFAGAELVGAATGLPLAHEPEALTRPFAEHGLKVEDVFYLGESVLLHRYRGQGVGVRFFAEREAHARALGGYRWTAFCAVVRASDHPRRPPDFVPLDAFWRRRGYAPVPGLVGKIAWRDLDEPQESAKPMQFWLKELA